MVDLEGQFLKIEKEVMDGIRSVISSSTFIQGPAVKTFEKNLAAHLNVKHCIACANGTDALQISMMALDLKPGDEIIVPSFTYIASVEAAVLLGIKPVFVEVNASTFNLDETQIEKAISSKTKAILVVHLYGQSAPMESILSIAKKHKIPTFLDAAADVPPVENLFKFQQMGFDLVTFSGGKMIRGPQSAGLLFGRKDLIEAAKLNHSPHEAPIGRPMKVNKEEMFGMYAALKSYLERDHKKEWEEWLDRTKRIAAQLTAIPTLKTEVWVDPGPANAFPSLRVDWDQQRVKIAPKEVSRALKEGTPSIVVGGHDEKLLIGVVLLRPDQIDVVAKRVKEVLQQAV